MATNFETKKINELTEAAEVEDSDLTVTGDPGTGLLKKITFKNLILSIKDRLLGNTSEIADMGDGTVTGAIKQLDSDISDTQEITTDAFDETKSYAVGDYCIYDNTLYKFKEEKSAGEWDDEAVEKTNTMAALNSALADIVISENTDYIYSFNVPASSYADSTFSVSKDGYTFLGVVGWYFINSSSGGQNSSYCFLNRSSISETTLTLRIGNRANTDAVIDVRARVLYIKN